jgi:hypothetical protein
MNTEDKMPIIDKWQIVQKIDNGEYSMSNIEYPRDLSQSELDAIQKEVEAKFVGTLAQIKAEVVKRQKAAKAKVTRAQNTYESQKDELFDQFQEDLFELFEVQENPKRHLCFEKAWNMSDGYADTMDRFESLVELIRNKPTAEQRREAMSEIFKIVKVLQKGFEKGNLSDRKRDVLHNQLTEKIGELEYKDRLEVIETIAFENDRDDFVYSLRHVLREFKTEMLAIRDADDKKREEKIEKIHTKPVK